MRLPPLRAIQVFESSARLGSFQKAAAELAVTPGAVSKQIQLLENELGYPLFARLHRAVELTETGRAFFAEVGEAFEQLTNAAARARRPDRSRTLHIYCSSLFMQNWLTPRLPAFRDRAPNLDVAISIGAPRQPLPVDADVGIRLGRKRVSAHHSHHLFNVDVVPVASPAYLDRTGRPQKAADLASHVLLVSLVRPDMWREWLRSSGADFPIGRLISFPDASSAYHAALKGVGIAVAYEDFARRDMAAGLLEKPFDRAVRYPEAYYLVYPRANATDPKVAAFRDWMLEEVRRKT